MKSTATDELEGLNVADARIMRIDGFSGDVKISLVDWRDDEVTLSFENVIAVEAYSPEDVELSHLRIRLDSEHAKRVCSLVGEDFASQLETSFISAWNEQPVLTIVGDFRGLGRRSHNTRAE